MRVTLRCILSQSVLSRYRCVQHYMLKTKRDLTNSAGKKSDLVLSLDTDTCIVHKQTNKDCTLRATINSDRSATSGVYHKQGEKQPRGRDASATRRNNLVNVGKYTNLITLLDLCVSSQQSPNTVTRLSHNSFGHGVVGVNIVVFGCSSQQKQMKRRKSDF